MFNEYNTEVLKIQYRPGLVFMNAWALLYVNIISDVAMVN